MKYFGLLFVLLGITSMSFAQQVTTQNGIVNGKKKGNIYSFLGIPFAKAPVGNLRWKPTQAVEDWTEPIDAYDYSPVCPQKNTIGGVEKVVGDEDCLYLNIWTPSFIGNKAVMVFIHGGGNQVGGASTEQGGTQFYDGTNLSDRGDVVVVTIQYRLGALGFLVHPGLDATSQSGKSGNFAVLDQIQALKWIKQNISAFGGDTTRIMVFGESAGGLNTGNLLLTPKASNLFNRACIESAIPLLSPYVEGRSKGKAFADHFKSTGTDQEKIAYLSTLPIDSLVSLDDDPVSGGVVQSNWSPVVDDDLFSDQPKEIFQSGNYNHMPLIIGSNADEMSLNAPQTVTPTQMSVLINALPQAFRSQAAMLYPPGSTNEEAKASYIAFLTDAQFTSTTRRTAQCVSATQDEEVYRYLFSHVHTVAVLKPFGSYHGMELFFVFNTWENATLGTGFLFKEDDEKVQNNMLTYWTNFAKYGNPNGLDEVEWTRYDGTKDNYMDIHANPVLKEGLRTEKCQFWDDLVNYDNCIDIVSSLEEGAQNENKIFVFPNPSVNSIKVNIHGINQFVYQIHDINGRTVIQNNIASPNETIDISGLPPSVYVFTIQANGQTFSRLLVKI